MTAKSGSETSSALRSAEFDAWVAVSDEVTTSLLPEAGTQGLTGFPRVGKPSLPHPVMGKILNCLQAMLCLLSLDRLLGR